MKKKNKLLKFLSLLILINLVGAIWQSISVSADKKKYVPVGKYIDLLSYNAHYYTKGDGNTAFIFISGSGTPCAYTDFYKLQDRLSKYGQTVSFDHAGSGWSESTKVSRSIDNLVNELSCLIDKTAPDKKIVLVCHSLGSLEAIGYTQKHTEKVKGIIFLDSGTPLFYSKDSELLAKIMNRSFAFVRTIGLNRLFGELGFLLPMYGENIRNRDLPSKIKPIDKAMYYQHAGNIDTLNTVDLMNENARKVVSGSKLRNIPILVLASDSDEKWDNVQKQLCHLSDNYTYVKIKNSEHYLYWSDYNDVEINMEDFIKKNFLCDDK